MARGRRLDLAFHEEAHRLSPDEVPRLQELTYGTVRLRGRIDHLLDHHLHRGVGQVPPPLLDILRLGAYELLYLRAVPAYAAVSQAVEQGRKVGGSKGASLVNAVLRALARTGEDPSLFPRREVDPEGYFATWGSHPRWLVKRWLARWGVEGVERLVERDNHAPDLFVRPLRIPIAEALSRLEEEGLPAAEVPDGGGCIRLDGRPEPGRVVRIVEGIVQDPAAALVTLYAQPPEGGRVADLCAAPGGKALALAATGASVLAGDRSLRRLQLLQETARRLAFPVGLVVALAERPPIRSADLVLVDVPCSGTGTLARHPDARWRLRPEEPGVLAAVQARILDGSGAVVPPGGLLVYSTCTMEWEENEEQVRSFMARHPEFEVEVPPRFPTRYLDDEGFLRILPHETRFDGAFAARLRRQVRR